MATLKKLRPYFDRRNGTVTVGNSCPLSDAAAALLVMSEERARELGYVKDNDILVMTAGSSRQAGSTDLIRVLRAS